MVLRSCVYNDGYVTFLIHLHVVVFTADTCLVTSVGGNGSFISTAIMSLDILGIPKVLKPPIIITMKHLKVGHQLCLLDAAIIVFLNFLLHLLLHFTSELLLLAYAEYV